MVTPPWEEPLLSCLIVGASIHQRRLKVLSEPCWIVTHHTALTQTQPVVDPGGQSQSA